VGGNVLERREGEATVWPVVRTQQQQHNTTDKKMSSYLIQRIIIGAVGVVWVALWFLICGFLTVVALGFCGYFD
jgi:hypothetical protein